MNSSVNNTKVIIDNDTDLLVYLWIIEARAAGILWKNRQTLNKWLSNNENYLKIGEIFALIQWAKLLNNSFDMLNIAQYLEDTNRLGDPWSIGEAFNKDILNSLFGSEFSVMLDSLPDAISLSVFCYSETINDIVGMWKVEEIVEKASLHSSIDIRIITESKIYVDMLSKILNWKWDYIINESMRTISWSIFVEYDNCRTRGFIIGNSWGIHEINPVSAKIGLALIN